MQDSASTFHDELPAAPHLQRQPALPIDAAALLTTRRSEPTGRSPALLVFLFVVMFAAGGAIAWHWSAVESKFAQTCKDVGDWRNTLTKSLIPPPVDYSQYMTPEYPLGTFSVEDIQSLQLGPIDVMGEQSQSDADL